MILTIAVTEWELCPHWSKILTCKMEAMLFEFRIRPHSTFNLCWSHHSTLFSLPHCVHFCNMIKKVSYLTGLLWRMTHGCEALMQCNILCSTSVCFTWVVLLDWFSGDVKGWTESFAEMLKKKLLTLVNSLHFFTWIWRQLWPVIM